MSEVSLEVKGRVGFITLDRPRAMNALTLAMVRELTAALQAWRDDPQVLAVAVRGMGREGPFGAFCAGGDIRYFHQAALAGDPGLDAFFTEEYALDHLIHCFPKPYIAFMDGVVMGGGMGISQGGSVRIVTERTRMAMPETRIGLFPDVGGGYFLSRCPGRLGEYLALTGCELSGAQAVAAGLADGQVDAARLPVLWETLGATPFDSGRAAERWILAQCRPAAARAWPQAERIDAVFSRPTVGDILQALQADAASDPWARETLEALRKGSPLMLHVVLEQIRRARSMSLADDLRMERGLVHHCFHLRPGAQSETVEGIRALVVDKDQTPRWRPARSEEVTPEMVSAFFESPWAPQAHPLAALG